MKYTLDAQDKKVGRVASEAAKLLMGKNTTSFVRNAIPNIEVEIINAKKASVGPKKMQEKLHPRFSGYPSGIKIPTVAHVIEKKGYRELFRLGGVRHASSKYIASENDEAFKNFRVIQINLFYV
jgi:ribosomal protein L13